MYRDHSRLHTIAVELQAPSLLLNDQSVYCTAIILAIAVGIFKSVPIKLFKVRRELLQLVLAKEAVYWERKTCKSFNLKTIAHVSYLLFFRIHGHEMLMEAPSYTRQCHVRAFMGGMKFFDEGNPFNGKMCVEKLKPTKTYCHMNASLIYCFFLLLQSIMSCIFRQCFSVYMRGLGISVEECYTVINILEI
jgi:hypothetical protein